jgi:hypothetical protein
LATTAAGVPGLSGDNSTTIYTFLKEDMGKIEGGAKTGEMERSGGKLQVSK